MLREYGNVGPLRILKVKAQELKTGDIIMEETTYRNLLVTRSYGLDHIRKQIVDVDGVETDPKDPDPLQGRQYDYDVELHILRAKSYTNPSLDEALNSGDGSYKP